MSKHSWLKTCLRMAHDYLPGRLYTAEDNIEYVPIDASDDVSKVTEIMRRMARENLEYLKHQGGIAGLYADAEVIDHE